MGNVCAKDNTETNMQDQPKEQSHSNRLKQAAPVITEPEPVAPTPAAQQQPIQAQPVVQEHREPIPQSPARPVDHKPVDEVKIPEHSHVGDYEETAKMNPMAPEVQKTSQKFPPRDVKSIPALKEFSGIQQKTVRHKITGDTYHGTMERGVPHGFGYFITKTGEFIEGQFVEGTLKEENVRQISADGTFYEGGFKNHKRFGKGYVITPKNIKSESNYWNDGMILGEYTDTDLTSNTVVFQGGRNEKGYHGPFTVNQNDYTVKGTYKDGAFSGPVKKSYKNGRIYEGALDNAYFEEGQGTLTFVDGRKFQGPFSKGLPNGEGTFTSDTGKTSKQTWKLGKRV